jgi:predicted transcriptional regulator
MLNISSARVKPNARSRIAPTSTNPPVSRKQVIGKHVNDVVERLFGGSAESLVMSLLETKHLTPEKLARLQELVEKSNEEADENK